MYVEFIYPWSKTVWHIYNKHTANQNRSKNNKFLTLN